MVTLQAGNLVPVPFEEMVDPATNRTRIRHVDLSSYSYHVARAYMIRLEKPDIDSPIMLAALAAEAKLTPHQFRERFEPAIDGAHRLRNAGPAPRGPTGPQLEGIPAPMY